MRIRKLEIKGFGRLSGFNAAFDDGINLIYGVNESGKSTLQQFIMSMLYGLRGGRTGKDGLPAPIKRYRPWKGTEYGGSLEYTLDNGEGFRLERDFNSGSLKIYDSLYNDITASFITGKDRNPLIAEQHLGMDEACFERTVLVRQMESRLESGGMEELNSRLANTVQTGFEDVSFNKARDALKDALKNRVGTGRTSVKPLDRTAARLRELNSLRNDLHGRRKELLDMELRLNNIENAADALKFRQASLGLLEEIWDMADALKQKKQVMEALKGLHETAGDIQQETDSLVKRLKELAELEEEYRSFSGFGEEDMESIDTSYAGYSRVQERIWELGKQISAARRDTEIIELKMRRAAESGSDEAGTRLLELDREAEILGRELQGLNTEALKEECTKARSRSRRDLTYAIITITAAVAAAAAAIYVIPLIFAAAAILFTAAVVFAAGWMRWSGEYVHLNGQRRDALTRSNTIRSEITEKQREISSILRTHGAADLKDFFRIKADQESLKSQLESVREHISAVEQEQSEAGRSIAAERSALLERLYAAGITEGNEKVVKPEYIRYFKEGVRNCNKVRQEKEYIRRRLEELRSGMDSCLKNVQTVCSIKCESLYELHAFTEKINAEILTAEDQLKDLERGAGEAFASLFGESEQLSMDQLLLGDESAAAALKQLKMELQGNMEASRLEIKELETLIRDRDKESDRLLEVEAEIESLEHTKRQLEELEFSLKTALDELTCASEEIRRDYAPALNSTMSSIMGEITSGRYMDMKADSSLYLKIPAPETGDVVPVLSLSGGTVDQAYLSMRIALAEMLCSGGEILPLILDEVFAQYDDQRTMETLKYLKKLSDERQVLLFTCKSREMELISQTFGNDTNVIRL